MRRQTHGRKMPRDALGLALRQQPQPGGEREGEREPDGDRFAMEQAIGKSGGGLQGVRERVAEVEQRPLARFALVADDDRGFGAAAGRDRVLARRSSCEHLAPVRFEPGEKPRVVDQAVLDDLGIARPKNASRKRVEQRRIRHHQARLVEDADQILALARIDRGLAAERGIDLGKQRRRHLNDLESAPHDRRREAGKIADDAAAERHDHVAALDAGRDQIFADLLEHAPALRAFARRHDQMRGTDARPLQRRLGGGEVMRSHGGIGDDGRRRAGPQRRYPLAQSGESSAADDDVITASAERHVDGGRFARTHGSRHDDFLSCRRTPSGPSPSSSRSASAARISSTIISCGTSRECTLASAWA